MSQRPTCPKCHSENRNLKTEATAYWFNDTDYGGGCWELGDSLDGVKGDCDDCGATDIVFEWVAE